MSSSTTQTKNLIRMSVDVAATGAQDSTSAVLGPSPFLGGGTVQVRMDALDGTAIVKLQQAPRFDPATGAKPATGSALWTDIATFGTTAALTQEVGIALDSYHIRANVTTAHAASFV